MKSSDDCGCYFGRVEFVLPATAQLQKPEPNSGRLVEQVKSHLFTVNEMKIS
jgi:hypothetical protein